MKKGFTLIELLAVIIILAVIALILIPGINKIVDNAKMATFKESVNNIISSGENYISKYIVEHPGDEPKYPITFICNGDACTNGNNESLTFEGKVPKEGNLILRGEQDIYAEYISDGKYCASGTKGNLQVYSNCDDIDVTGPTVSVAADFQDLTITIIDNKSGAGDYCLSQTNDASTCKWISNNDEEVNHHVDIEQDTTYYVFAKDKKGNVSAPFEILVQYVYREVLLNGSYPVLKDNLIPVTIENDGTVHKANLKQQWYKYENKAWANAVILKDNTITYIDDEVIPESNIDGYFVWIPKYSYKLFDMGNYDSEVSPKPANSNAKTIDIVFGKSNTTDTETSCATPMISGTSGNCAVGKYMTHPAFISFGVNGFWMGKFELSGTTNDLDIKPNKKSLTNLAIKNFFIPSYNYNRNLDSHMIKNTEWGAVAYLSLSNYGINDEVRINNSSSFTTGCAATNHNDTKYSGCANSYNTPNGYLASTSGNITGVYDMSGGASEYVAGHISKNNGYSQLNSADYDSKYFDEYSTSSATTSYNYRILGDATGEIGPFYKDGSYYNNNWFNDRSHFLDGGHPWFSRSFAYGSGAIAGQLTFYRGQGSNVADAGSRLVLSPQ